MKKILFITNYRGMSPFITSFVAHLNKVGYAIDVFDTEHLRLYRNGVVIKQYILFDKLKDIKIPKISKYIRRFCYYYCFCKIEKYEIIVIFYLSSLFSYQSKILKAKSKLLIILYAGSDFYRATRGKKEKDKTILNICDKIVLASDRHKADFNVFYKNIYNHKIVYAGLGLDELDSIDKNIDLYSKKEIKKYFDIPLGSIIVTIGYNGIKEQQHLKIINAIKNNKYNKDIFYLFPMTYSLQKDYKLELENRLNELGFKYLIIDTYLNNDDIAKIKIISDIVINLQISDAASRSLLEYIYSGNIMLVADWLPYEYWQEMGINYYTINFNNLSSTLEKVIENLRLEKNKCKDHKNIIKNNWSWDVKINEWIKLFEQ